MLARLALWCGILQVVEFGFDCCKIGVDAFFEQACLAGIGLFAARTVAKVLQQRNFMRGLVDARLTA